jgi:hypothetical protein
LLTLYNAGYSAIKQLDSGEFLKKSSLSADALVIYAEHNEIHRAIRAGHVLAWQKT